MPRRGPRRSRVCPAGLFSSLPAPPGRPWRRPRPRLSCCPLLGPPVAGAPTGLCPGRGAVSEMRPVGHQRGHKPHERRVLLTHFCNLTRFETCTMDRAGDSGRLRPLPRRRSSPASRAACVPTCLRRAPPPTPGAPTGRGVTCVGPGISPKGPRDLPTLAQGTRSASSSSSDRPSPTVKTRLLAVGGRQAWGWGGAPRQSEAGGPGPSPQSAAGARGSVAP